MISRDAEITEFLKKEYTQKNERSFGIELIYQSLFFYDLNDKDKNNFIMEKSTSSSNKPQQRAYDDYYKYLKEFYKDKNLDIFEGSKHYGYGFYHFYSKIDDSNYNAIKLYLNVPQDSFLQVFMAIEDYIVRNNIFSFSKFHNGARNDGYVIRIKNYEDAEKLLDFINNSAIKNKLQKTNPFSPRVGSVGLVFDNLVSYNKAVSYVIYNYINEVSDISKVNYNSFKEYTDKLYNDIFKNHSRLEEFLSSCIFNNSLNNLLNDDRVNVTKEEILLDYKNVFELIIVANYTDKFQNILSYYLPNTDSEKRKNDARELYNAINIIDSKNSLESKTKILNEYIYYLYNSSYSSERIAKQLEGFYNGEINMITRCNSNGIKDEEHGFRKQFEAISPDDLMQITNNNILGYINVTLGIYTKVDSLDDSVRY